MFWVGCKKRKGLFNCEWKENTTARASWEMCLKVALAKGSLWRSLNVHFQCTQVTSHLHWLAQVLHPVITPMFNQSPSSTLHHVICASQPSHGSANPPTDLSLSLFLLAVVFSPLLLTQVGVWFYQLSLTLCDWRVPWCEKVFLDCIPIFIWHTHTHQQRETHAYTSAETHVYTSAETHANTSANAETRAR